MPTIKIDDDSKIILETLLRVRPDFTGWAAQNFPHLMKDRPISTWEEFTNRVIGLFKLKNPGFNMIRFSSCIRLVKLEPNDPTRYIGIIEFTKSGDILISQGGSSYSKMASERTYGQMLKIVENMYDEN